MSGVVERKKVDGREFCVEAFVPLLCYSLWMDGVHLATFWPWSKKRLTIDGAGRRFVVEMH